MPPVSGVICGLNTGAAMDTHIAPGVPFSDPIPQQSILVYLWS